MRSGLGGQGMDEEEKGKEGLDLPEPNPPEPSHGPFGDPPSGPPDTDSATDTQTRLIAAARRLFGERGYEGTSIRTITSAAGTNLGAVTYHFGSKEALYKEVIRAVLAPLQERLVRMGHEGGPVEQRLERLIRTVFEHLWENPDQARLMVEVRLYHSEWLPELAETLAPISTELLRIVAEGQEEGLVRPGPPLLFVMSLMAQPVYFMLLTRRAPPGLLPIDPHTEEGREAYLRHMVEFAMRGAGVDGAASPPPAPGPLPAPRGEPEGADREGDGSPASPHLDTPSHTNPGSDP